MGHSEDDLQRSWGLYKLDAGENKKLRSSSIKDNKLQCTMEMNYRDQQVISRSGSLACVNSVYTSEGMLCNIDLWRSVKIKDEGNLRYLL